jgi:hypothetical protein
MVSATCGTSLHQADGDDTTIPWRIGHNARSPPRSRKLGHPPNVAPAFPTGAEMRPSAKKMTFHPVEALMELSPDLIE